MMTKSLIIGISLMAFSQTMVAQNLGSSEEEKPQTTTAIETTNTARAHEATGENLGEIYANQQMQRLNEINEMDKSNLSFSQKRSLRKEVKEINKNMQANNGGIYFSAGAIIIIILLLILLL
jgi:hypothetical protein